MESGYSAQEPQEKSLVERFLSLFSNVGAGEGRTVLLLFLNAFIMMGLYYILKPVREGLIISGFGAVVKSYSSAAQALLFVFLVPLYGAFAARVNRVWLISGMTVFFISNLVLFVIALGAGLNIGVVYYIWVGIFNFMLISQFWAFANDLYSEEQGKRLFPIVGIGATFGALVGAWLSAIAFEQMTDASLLILASVLLGVFALLIVFINRREVSFGGNEASQKATETLSREGGFKLVVGSRYLLLIGFYVLLLNLVNTVGEYIISFFFEQESIIQVGAGDALRDERGLFIRTKFAQLFGWVNLFGFLIQTFLVSRFIKYLGVRGSLFIGPLVSLATYGTTALRPVLSTVWTMKIAENSNDYSTNNTVRAALFLPTSREVKYKAKAAIDTVFARTGDALQALVIFIGTRLAIAVPIFAVINVVFVVVWLLVCGGIVREHRKLTEDA